MPTPTAMEAKLLPVITITVEQKAPAEPKVYSCVLDFNAVQKCEETIGRDMTKFQSWQGLNHAQLTAIVWAELDRFHPEVTLREVRQWLNPMESASLWLALIEQAFPGITERLGKIVPEEPAKGKDEPSATIIA